MPIDHNKYLHYALPQKQKQWKKKKSVVEYYKKMETVKLQINPGPRTRFLAI